MRALTEGLHVSRNAGPTRRNGATAIDHVISTYRMSSVEKIETLSNSDHIPIKV